MFTGIVQGKFPIVAIEEKTQLKRLTVELSSEVVSGLKQGASVSVSGVCLTAAEINGNLVSFDVMLETLKKTTLGLLQIGNLVNIERSAKVGDEIGGHNVSGHVTGMAEIVHIEHPENNCAMTFKCDESWMKYILPKGFISLDGASLTVVNPNKQNGTFEVWFIPETLRLTTFGDKTVGDNVNLEIDPQTQAIVDTVERVLGERSE